MAASARSHEEQPYPELVEGRTALMQHCPRTIKAERKNASICRKTRLPPASSAPTFISFPNQRKEVIPCLIVKDCGQRPRPGSLRLQRSPSPKATRRGR